MCPIAWRACWLCGQVKLILPGWNAAVEFVWISSTRHSRMHAVRPALVQDSLSVTLLCSTDQDDRPSFGCALRARRPTDCKTPVDLDERWRTIGISEPIWSPGNCAIAHRQLASTALESHSSYYAQSVSQLNVISFHLRNCCSRSSVYTIVSVFESACRFRSADSLFNVNDAWLTRRFL